MLAVAVQLELLARALAVLTAVLSVLARHLYLALARWMSTLLGGHGVASGGAACKREAVRKPDQN
jgi:hypothetical protein